jgi:RNA polymerase sigma-70 factor (ECF subfamily)
MVAASPIDEDRLVQLMIGYQNGTMEDFTALYETLRTPLVRYLWTFVRDPVLAEDLLQETFLQVHRARHTYQPPRPVRPWIYAISRHVALMHLRSKRRRKEYLPSEELPEIPIPPEIEDLADRETVNRLLAELPRKGQEVLILHHLLGLSFQDVGKILGVATGTAKVRAHRAIKAIRERIMADGRRGEEA